jgi:hypothetical protein
MLEESRLGTDLLYEFLHSEYVLLARGNRPRENLLWVLSITSAALHSTC